MMLSILLLLLFAGAFAVGYYTAKSDAKQVFHSSPLSADLAENLRKIDTYLSMTFVDEEGDLDTQEVKIIDVLYSYHTRSLFYLCQDDEGYASIESVEAFKNPLEKNGNQADRY